MKRFYAVFTLVYLISHSIFAQLLIGPRVGLNMFTTSQEMVTGMDKSMQSSLAGGLAVGYEIGPAFNAFIEFNYMPGGQKYTYKKDILEQMFLRDKPDTTVTYNTNYFQMPVYFQVYYQKANKKHRFLLNIGPYLGFGKTDSVLLYQNDFGRPGKLRNYQRRGFDFGAIIAPGVQYKVWKGHVSLEARYQLGLNDVFKLSKAQIKDFNSSVVPLPKAQNRQFYIALGYTHFINVKKKDASWIGEPVKKKDEEKEEPKRRKRS